MFRKIFISIITIPLVIETNAQTNKPAQIADEIYQFSWNVNIPVNNQFVNKTSFDGFQLEYRKMIKPDLSVGAEFNWSGFDKYYPTKTYQIPNGAVTTDFYSYMYELPMAVNVHHYFHVNNMLYPYAGLALGATYAEMKLYYNTYVTSEENWGFLVMPEIGAIMKFSEYSGWGVLLGARYNYSTNKQTNFKINGLQSVGFQLGIVAMK